LFDLLVIGSGPGGYIAAIRAAQLGLKVAIVEKRKTLGGTCLNVGCIPSKALLHTTELLYTLQKKGAELGIQSTGLSIDLPQLMKRKEEVVASLVAGVGHLLEQHKVAHIEGEAAFSDEHTVVVGNESIEAKQILLATGSDSIAIPFLPFDEERVLSSTGALTIQNVPKRFVVIGGGVIGVEMASIYHRLGAETTIIEMLEGICLTMDQQLSRSLQQILSRTGMKIHTGTKVLEATVNKKEILLKTTAGEVVADQVLVAVGRAPYTKNLKLEKIVLQTDKRGFIPVDGEFRTALPHIFAIGDVIEGPMLAHRAMAEGVAVAELLGGLKPTLNYITIPNVIYTHPEVASVGLTEEQAKQSGFTTLTGTSYFKGNGRAHCNDDVDGFVKVVGCNKTGRLLGLHILGPQASELIAEGMIALEKRATLADIAYAPQAHPTLSEVIKEAAQAALKI